MKPALVSIALCLVLACTGPTAPISGQLTVRPAPLALKLTNYSPTAVYTFAIEQGALAYIDWAPCTDPSTCPGIGVGQSVMLPYSQIAGSATPGRDVVVFWWHLIPGGATGFQPDTIRAVLVTL